MALRPYPKKINVLARVVVTLPDVGQEYVVDWEDAAKAKDKAAKWLLQLQADAFPESLSVHVEVQQRSDDLTFIDRASWVGENDKDLGIEYAVKFLKTFPTWGRGR